MTDQPRIAVSGLCKSFAGERVLDGVELSVARGESLVLIGESGCGKTLTLKCIIGLVKPDAGRILIDGDETIDLGGAERERMLDRFGMLFQQAALFDSLPVWRNIAFRLLQDSRVDRQQARERAIETLRMVGLSADTADLLPAELSGGMQKRVGIARAIAVRPEILLLDEPTAGLDPIMSHVISNLVRRNVRELGATAISISSDIDTAVRIGDRIAVLNEGRVVWSGPSDTLADSGDAYVDRLINKWKVEHAAA